MRRIETIHYTEFRAEIYKLLDTYEQYMDISDTSPRVDIEDDIDNLFISLLQEEPVCVE